MSLNTIFKRRKLLAGIALVSCLIFSVIAILYKDDYYILPRINVNVPATMHRSRHRKILLPPNFDFPQQTLNNYFKGTSAEKWGIIQLKKREIISKPPLEPGRFKTTESFLYGSETENKCNGKGKMRIGTDKSEILSFNLSKIFEIFKEEMGTYSDSYNQHIHPLFEAYMGEEKFKSHWFRFSGSSVWLKDYNIHFVVSRLLFTENSERDNPRISFILAQIFDEKWQEVEDVRLVFPTNHLEDAPTLRIKDQNFMSYRFPRILPAPFLLGESGFYWGAEDPRIILVRNDKGYEEPMIVFNAYQAKKMVEEGESKVTGLRSIFMSLPFQIQRGKGLLAIGKDFTGKHFFMSTRQVMIEARKENKVEKNWTPFVSSSGNYDEHVYFATMLEPLKIIKCEIWTDNKTCTIEEDNNEGGVGAIRGGTPLYSIKRIDTEDKEFFFGFARAHLTKCGCGAHFYRPNLVVVSKKGRKWSLSHVSSSIDFGMDIIPWKDEENLCAGVNAMIPNGIESIDWERDLLSVDVSVSDTTVERVTIHGVLEALKLAKFWEEKEENEEANLGAIVSPVKCALEASVDFCKAYGEQHQIMKRFGY